MRRLARRCAGASKCVARGPLRPRLHWLAAARTTVRLCATAPMRALSWSPSALLSQTNARANVEAPAAIAGTPPLKGSAQPPTAEPDPGAGSSAGRAAGPASDSGVRRTNVGIFGAMNVGKSLLMNTLTQTETSIVDAKAGTTADAKVALIELHGIGPVRLVDTPGFDESGALGAKKQERVRKVLRETDVALVVVDPYKPHTVAVAAAIIAEARRLGFGAAAAAPAPAGTTGGVKQILVIYNLFRSKQQTAGHASSDLNAQLSRVEGELFGVFDRPNDRTAAASRKVASIGTGTGGSNGANSRGGEYHTVVVDLMSAPVRTNGGRADAGVLSAPSAVHKRLCAFIERWVKPQSPPVPLLPPMHELTAQGNPHRDAVVLLNIPMDAETPGGRLLRPQAHAQEALIRNFVSTFVYRMDLKKGRSALPDERRAEEQRFRRTVQRLGPALKLIVTDSQAIDLVHPWTLPVPATTAPESTTALAPNAASGAMRVLSHGATSPFPSAQTAPGPGPGPAPVPVTTFSVMQINYMSGGRLRQFVEGLNAFSAMQRGSRVLICEACNHNRIGDDIGVVQIPNKIRARWGDAVSIDFAFGREYQNKALADYDVVLHCGGCMLDLQQMGARLADLERANATAITNYGLVLAFFQSRDALARVIQPFGLTLHS